MRGKVKLVALVLIMVSALALFTGGQAALAAGGPGGLTYSSSIQVSNISTSTANISLAYYTRSSGALLGTVTDTVSVGSSKTYYPILNGVPNGPSVTSFDGSVVITSDQQVVAISNLVANNYAFGASYDSFSAGSTTFSLPLIMCNNSGFNTFFNVQNTGSATANITITYYKGSNGNNGLTETASIGAGAAKQFDQTNPSSTSTRNCSTLADGSGKFIGSAKITSDQPVVATVMQLNSTTFPILMGYDGFASGSPTVSVPLIMGNNSGFYTSIQVQNVGASSTTVTVTYSPNTSGGSFAPAADTFPLAAGASKTLIHNGTTASNGSTVNNWSTAGKYIGAATVTNTGGQNLVAIVNEASLGGGGLGPYGSAYEGSNPSAATAHASAPLIMANNSGYYTSIQVQNVGGSSCAAINVHYGPDTATADGAAVLSDENFSLAAGGSKTIIQNSTSPANGSTNNFTTKGKYIGSAIISATGCTIVGLINEFSPGAGDKLFSYDAFNY